jgi:hypothetical protein
LPNNGTQGHLGTTEVIAHCKEHTERFFRAQDHDEQYCFEMFRRALAEQDQAAWVGVFETYRAEVVGWVKARIVWMGKKIPSDELQALVNRAFAGFAEALAKPGRIANFSTLKSILQYLKACAHSAVREYTRSISRFQASAHDPSQPPDNSSMAAQVIRDECQKAIRQRVLALVKSKKERIIYQCVYELHLRPRHIFERYQEVFTSIQEIHRAKANFLKRLRRDPQMAALWRDCG